MDLSFSKEEVAFRDEVRRLFRTRHSTSPCLFAPNLYRAASSRIFIDSRRFARSSVLFTSLGVIAVRIWWPGQVALG